MFKQAFSMIFYRKKQALIVILVIALVMFLLLSISSVFSAVQDSTFLVAMEEYGVFTASIMTLRSSILCSCGK